MLIFRSHPTVFFLVEMSRRIRSLDGIDGRRWHVAIRRSMPTLDSRVLAVGDFSMRPGLYQQRNVTGVRRLSPG